MKESKAENLSQAIAALGRGDVIVFPTETLYGLGADALKFAAVDKVFQLKGRDPRNPIPVLVSDLLMLDALVAEISPLAKQLMACFWPGPLTLVLPARDDIPAPLVNTSGGVGVRISSQPIARKLVAMLGRPITATSANPSGQPAARTAAQARAYFSGAVDIFVDGGKLTSSSPSTVAEVVGEKVAIIRHGAIGAADLRNAVGKGAFET
ncbi:MAG TPA: L-threonylcarbamoyladenylate synthase [Candidatus Binatia bacterium]|nr:L-threonylcarbamoyladenylate synthase [Candidatus Binatia bacterium]